MAARRQDERGKSRLVRQQCSPHVHRLRCRRRSACARHDYALSLFSRWKVDKQTGDVPPPESLAPLLSARTRVVALTHVSNILGTVADVGAATSLVRTATGAGPGTGSGGAAVVVDGVAYVPHKAPDVAAIGCDWCAHRVPIHCSS